MYESRMAPPHDESDILYFCDETSQIDDDFMAVGGLAIRRGRIATIVADLRELNEQNGVISEVKWTTAKKRRVSVHSLYAEYLARLIRGGHAHLHIRFAPFNEYDHRNSGPRGRIDTVSKMYFQLLLHRAAAFYGRKGAIYVHPDNGDCTSYLPLMRDQLCAAAYRSQRCKPNCVRVIEPRDSSSEPMLQLLDVTLGAFAALRNGRELAETKQKLAEHVLDLHDAPDIKKNSPRTDRRFNIWNVEPQH